MVLIIVPCHEPLSIVLGTLSNNRMGKTSDLFKKIRDTKGIFHAKISTIKDRNGMDLTEAEDTMKKDIGGDRISAELFKIIKVDAIKVLHSVCQQIWKTQQWP